MRGISSRKWLEINENFGNLPKTDFQIAVMATAMFVLGVNLWMYWL